MKMWLNLASNCVSNCCPCILKNNTLPYFLVIHENGLWSLFCLSEVFKLTCSSDIDLCLQLFWLSAWYFAVSVLACWMFLIFCGYFYIMRACRCLLRLVKKILDEVGGFHRAIVIFIFK